MTPRRLLLASLFSLTALASAPAFAFDKNGFDSYVQAPNFNPADKDRIARATAYLQGLSTGKGRFRQTDFRGRTVDGNWFLARPGKIRFEYDAPSSILIVADGRQVKMWDPRLQSFDAYPLDETPLSLFLSRQIRFDQGVIVVAVSSNANGFTLKARDRRKQVEGSVTLVFGQAPNGALTLQQWTIVDAQNRPTTIQLTSFTRDSQLDPGLFVLNKPALKK